MCVGSGCDRTRQPGAQHRLARRGLTLTGRQDAAHDHFFHVCGLEARAFDRGLDGSILVFRDDDRDPKWSFAEVDAGGIVVRVAEKQPISDLATVGIYLFRRGRDFVAAAADMIANNDRVNGEFYTCPVYNYAIRAGARVGVWEIPQTAMHGLGTPDDLDAFIAERNSGTTA